MTSYRILNGNELIVQGALEAGFSLYTGYPGSPLADYFNILHAKRKELETRGIRVVIANSEANAAAMASGAKQAGRDCLVGMKSMGLHVASDALSVGNFANPCRPRLDPETNEEIYPGVVIAVGDDPWSISTSTPADSRYLYKHLHIPFLEPSTPQELKDWMKHALWISQRSSVYQGILLTTFMAEGGGRVTCGDWAEVNKDDVHLDPSTFDLTKNVMVPPNSLLADREMIENRFPEVEKLLEKLRLDQTFGNMEDSGVSKSQIGFLSSGVVFETLKQVLEEGELLDHFSLYKLACSYPICESLILPWLQSLNSLIIVEEKRGFLELQITELCQKHGLSLKIYGKSFDGQAGFPAHGGLNFEQVQEGVKRVLELLNSNSSLIETCREMEYECFSWQSSSEEDGSATLNLPKRLPTFCPGCPHRETLSLLVDLRKKLKQKGVDLISHGDVGCYSLSFLPPFKEMHNLSAMGQGGALGAGVDLFTSNPSVVLMGDSTFFHSGMTDISNSLQCGHNITYILLDNDNTAMTGHQMTPRSGVSVDGHQRPRQDMLNLVKSLGVGDAIEVNPSDRYFYQNLLIDYIDRKGVKVIISNKECALTYHGRKKSQERKDFAQNKVQKNRTFYHINTDSCEDCRACVDLTGCPGLGQVLDPYGTKVMIDPQICVSDGYCTKIKACPSFEKVDVRDYHPTMYKEKNTETGMSEDSIPLPKHIHKSFDDIKSGQDLRIVVTGVGGSGVTTISKVLSKAAQHMNGEEGIDFKFMDQKGLAQRNGNVTAHLCFYPKGQSRGAVTPNGTADLLLSPDLLDGGSHISFLQKESGLSIFDQQFQIPLTLLLDRGEQEKPLTPQKLREALELKLGSQVVIAPLKDVCYQVFGKAVYASAMILGVAFQKGYLPFDLSELKHAFETSVPKSEFDHNWKAFQLGRQWVEGKDLNLDYDQDAESEEKKSLTLIRQSLKESMLPWHSKKSILKFFNRDLGMLERFFPEIPKSYLARYMHDIYIYDRGQMMDSFMEDASFLKDFYKDAQERQHALSILVRTYFIKDEVFISHAMLSPMQRDRDHKLYANLGKSFTKTRINRPSFDVFGKTIEFDLSPKDWMLKIMRHLRLLRTILPSWHAKEKEIAKEIRRQLKEEVSKLEHGKRYQALKKLENIKGYRQVRYEKAVRRLGGDRS